MEKEEIEVLDDEEGTITEKKFNYFEYFSVIILFLMTIVALVYMCINVK